eukprot:5371167-Prymnesium_polylepis.2
MPFPLAGNGVLEYYAGGPPPNYIYNRTIRTDRIYVIRLSTVLCDRGPTEHGGSVRVKGSKSTTTRTHSLCPQQAGPGVALALTSPSLSLCA